MHLVTLACFQESHYVVMHLFSFKLPVTPYQNASSITGMVIIASCVTDLVAP